IYLGQNPKGQCEAVRVRPSLGYLTVPPHACAVAPDRLASPLDPAEGAALGRIAADDPRRAFGQPRGDPGRVAWAGERGYYLPGATLRSASRPDGPPRDEPPPFPSRRAPIAWGAFAPDGEGVAYAEGVVHAGLRSEIERLPAPLPASAAFASMPDLP